MKKEEYELKRVIDTLKRHVGRGTELITVLIPDGYPIHEITNKLREEYSQASNIKSKTTRKNVLSALEKIMGFLKMYKTTPKNGLAVFCGNLSDNPGVSDIELFSVVPPFPLQIQTYRCDSQFFLEPLERMLESSDIYGLVTISRQHAAIATLKGKYVEINRVFNSGVHSKHQKGGQSAQRFERQIEEDTKRFYRKVAESMKEIFEPYLSDLKGIIIGGPGPTKEYFLKESEMDYRLKDKILGMIDTGYADDSGIRELVEKMGEIVEKQELLEERKLANRFLREISRGGKATYGPMSVIEALKEGRVGTLLISETLDLDYAKCDGKEQILKPEDKKECEERKPLVDYLMELAEEYGTEVEFITDSTQEGAQVVHGFGGLAALLRY